MDFLYDFLVNIIAGFVGALIVLIVLEKRKRSRLKIVIDPAGFREPNFVLLRVLILNEPMEWPLKYLYERETASMCTAWINFYYTDGRPIYNRGEMRGRWSETPIPRYESDRYNPWAIENYLDISPDSHATLDIVFKYPHENLCYGFNNDSYDTNRCTDYRSEWSINQGQYLVRVRVKTGEKVFSDVFRLINEMDFRLETIDDNDLQQRLK